MPLVTMLHNSLGIK